jgi:hypothetical protein
MSSRPRRPLIRSDRASRVSAETCSCRAPDLPDSPGGRVRPGTSTRPRPRFGHPANALRCHWRAGGRAGRDSCRPFARPGPSTAARAVIDNRQRRHSRGGDAIAAAALDVGSLSPSVPVCPLTISPVQTPRLASCHPRTTSCGRATSTIGPKRPIGSAEGYLQQGSLCRQPNSHVE